MKLNKEMFTSSMEKDVELRLMIAHLELEPRMKTLELGCCDTELSCVLERVGCESWGVDIRPCPCPKKHFIQGDFLDVSLPENYFDIAIDVSAIHHFGLGAYGDELELNADIKASMKVYSSLKKQGIWYIVMDRFKTKFVPNLANFVRQYDFVSFKDRICRNFQVEYMKFYDVRMNEVPLNSEFLEILCTKLIKGDGGYPK